ncbi:hypothetical protein [Muribaculum gordoncarteri]|uniref:hypothetical protein n=1 Tax=Muribaculum gordoncarteri TaxID=2530390 RepID=UPI003F67889C
MAAAAIAFTGGYGELGEYLAENGEPADSCITYDRVARAFGGMLAILGVVAAPISTGDTALRCARLIAADFMHCNQKAS